MALQQTDSLATARLRLDSLSHIALPVRDLDRSEFFYTRVLGATFIRRVEIPASIPPQRYDSRLEVRWGPIDLQLFRQPFGERSIQADHPHHAFTTRGSQIDRWQDLFTSWGIPSDIVCRQHGQKGMGDVCSVELYFMDPDGNSLELDADDYVFSERVVWAPFDQWDLVYNPSQWWESHKHTFTARKS